MPSGFTSNLMVNCKFGLRIVNNPPADTTNTHYGYNYEYGDSLSVVNQIYLTNASLSGGWTRPQPSDIPDYTTFLAAGYKYGDTYDGTPAVGNYDFRLQTNSPAIGKGYLNFSPLAAVPVDPVYGVTEITLPGKDIGAFQLNGTGNQHYP